MAARIGVLGGVVEQVGQDLLEPGRVRLDEQRLGGHRYCQLVPLPFDERTSGFHGAADESRQVDDFLAQLDLAPADARHVEQVVDQPGHVLDLALDHVPGPSCQLPVAPACFMMCSALRIGARGLRSSWASIARNSSLRRSVSRNSA